MIDWYLWNIEHPRNFTHKYTQATYHEQGLGLDDNTSPGDSPSSAED